MRVLPHLLCVAAALSFGTAAIGAEGRIGFAAPLDGPNALLGQQMRDGARLASGAEDVELLVVEDGCSAQSGEAAAQRFVEADVGVAAGFLCTETLEAALPILKDAGIPVITSGVRSNGVTDRRQRTGWLVWRVAPRADAELAAVSDILVPRWRTNLFAIVDDGTIHGRELAESLRLGAELSGLKPMFVDTYRPQSENQIGLVGRLRRAGATHVFVGGDRDDVAIIARDAASLDYDLTIAGGEALRATGHVPLAVGTLMIGLPEWADLATESQLAFFRDAGVVPLGYVVPSYVAVQVAAATMRIASLDRVAPGETLPRTTFDTLAGSLHFDENGDLAQNPFRLLRYDGIRFLAAE